MSPRLVTVLQPYRRALITALDGRSLRVEIRTDDPPRREPVLLMDDGRVVVVSDEMLLDRSFDPQVTLAGNLRELASIALGETTLKDAVRAASLITTVPLAVLAPVRDVLTEALHAHTATDG